MVVILSEAKDPCILPMQPTALGLTKRLNRLAHSSLKSRQVGFSATISAIFFARVHPLISFSRAIARVTVAYLSK
jgi:hypothetical protein